MGKIAKTVLIISISFGFFIGAFAIYDEMQIDYYPNAFYLIKKLNPVDKQKACNNCLWLLVAAAFTCGPYVYFLVLDAKKDTPRIYWKSKVINGLRLLLEA
ncbi:MAG: hypothetical protein ABIG60_03070 [Patescibacteria group bacterium]